MNQLSHLQEFPDPSLTNVVRPNVDTVYSVLLYDVSKQLLVIGVPDSGALLSTANSRNVDQRVFAAPGKRATGTAAQTFAIVGLRWEGAPPADIREIHSSTNFGWIIGRTQTNGKSDYAAVHNFQSGITAALLDEFGKPYTHPRATVYPHRHECPGRASREDGPCALLYFVRGTDETESLSFE